MTTEAGDDVTCAGRPARYWIASLIYDAMRQQATDALCASGKAVIPSLAGALKDPNNRIRDEAGRILKTIDPEAPARAGVR